MDVEDGYALVFFEGWEDNEEFDFRYDAGLMMMFNIYM